MSSFLLYSSHTSLTAPRLAQELNIPCGTSPRAANLIIAYGAGSGWTVPAGAHVINHPNSIRNKLQTLDVLKRANVDVAPFAAAAGVREALRRGTLSYPIIGRRMVHQSGSGFFLCMNDLDLAIALNQGAAYFQNKENISVEYRVHVLGNTAPVVYKKELRGNPATDLIREVTEETVQIYPRAGVNTDAFQWALRRMTKRMTLPDLQIRSTSRGWYFRQISAPESLVTTRALAAIRAMGMDFGAVDVMKLINNRVKVIEINSGPGMDIGGLTFRTYVSKFREWIRQYGERTQAPRSPQLQTRPSTQGPVIRGNIVRSTRRPARARNQPPRARGERVIRAT